jgi:hypothetical protein
LPRLFRLSLGIIYEVFNTVFSWFIEAVFFLHWLYLSKHDKKKKLGKQKNMFYDETYQTIVCEVKRFATFLLFLTVFSFERINKTLNHK